VCRPRGSLERSPAVCGALVRFCLQGRNSVICCNIGMKLFVTYSGKSTVHEDVNEYFFLDFFICHRLGVEHSLTSVHNKMRSSAKMENRALTRHRYIPGLHVSLWLQISTSNSNRRKLRRMEACQIFFRPNRASSLGCRSVTSRHGQFRPLLPAEALPRLQPDRQ